MMAAFHPLRLPPTVRTDVTNFMLKLACPELLYAFMFCGTRLVQCVRPRRFTLDPVDYHVLINFVRNSTSYRSADTKDKNESEEISGTWTPICLPMFDEKGFLHALIYYISEDILLVLLSTKVDAYRSMAERAKALEKALTKNHVIEEIKREYSVPSFSVPSILSEKEEVYHFVFRSTHLRQVIYPSFGRYSSPSKQKRLLRVYQKLRTTARNNMSCNDYYNPPNANGEAQSQVLYQTSQYETVVSFITRKFELYVTVSASQTKSLAMKSCLSVLQWISSNEPDLFIPSFPSWS